MPAPPCPKCGAATTFAGYDPWCPSCGWNREQAGKRLGAATRKIWVYYVFAAVMFGAFFRVWNNPQRSTLLFVFVLPLVPLLLLYASLRWSRGRYEKAMRDYDAGVRPDASPPPTQAARPASTDFKTLLEISRPRPVRVSKKGRSNLVIAMAGVAAFNIIFLANAWQKLSAAGSFAALSRADWLWLVFAVAMLLIPYMTWKNVQRQRALLENGEMALATVVRQFSNRSTSTVQFEFQDASGEKQRGLATDNTRSLYEGMTVPVFYDPQNPRLRVAQCESFCEVILPGGE